MNRTKLITIVGIVVLAVILIAWGPAPKSDGDANVLRIVSTSAPDSLDSGVSYMASSWQMQVNVYDGLLTYKKVAGPDGTTLVPDIASAMPVYSDGGKTLTFHVRKGVMFGAPANREVKPSDFKYTIERNAKIPSQGAFFYSVVQGFDAVKNHKAKTVSGIDANDATGELVFHLTRADATFLNVLALPFSFVVPKGLPAYDMSQKGFSSATGPYAFSEYSPGRQIVMKRNPAFKQWTPDTPTGKVDRIEVKLGVSDENAITLIMQGKADAASSAIPRSKLPMLLKSSEWKPYLHTHEMSRTSYMFMNNRVAPFNNKKVRQAVNWAINRRAMVKLSGGSGTPSSTILPPTMKGYDPHEVYPKQDMAKAKQLIKESGVTPGEIVIWCMTTPPNPDSASYVQAQLTQLGFKVRTRCVDGSSYYALVGAESTKAQIGFGSWGADFPEGSNFIDVNFNSEHIIKGQQVNNYAFYGARDKEIDAANKLLNLNDRAKAWGKLDREIVEDGAWAPISHGIQRNLVGKRVGDYVFHPVYDMLFETAAVDGSGTNNGKYHDTEVGAPKDDDGAAEVAK
jgi:peptide/nickel transport system substrate-binding protein